MIEKNNVLFEDDGLLIIDKPAGITVNRSESQRDLTVQDWVEDYLGIEVFEETVDEVFIQRSGVVHRLDKETSGVLVLAKNPNSFNEMLKAFRERKVKKTYHAISWGLLPERRVEVTAPIKRNPKNRFKCAVVQDGKEASTTISMLNSFDINGEMFSALEVVPHTGRTHQIRVHLAALNCPIAGDTLYSTKRQFAYSQELFGRMMLHALQIEFIHPIQGNELKIISKLPTEFTLHADVTG